MSYNTRINALKTKLETFNLNGMYVTNLTNVRYLTGFTGSAGSLLVLENEQHFFTDGRYIEQSKSQVKNCKIHKQKYIQIRPNSRSTAQRPRILCKH